jgi:ribosome biogenesis GTPase / thiamine phosphate phosphatase
MNANFISDSLSGVICRIDREAIRVLAGDGVFTCPPPTAGKADPDLPGGSSNQPAAGDRVEIVPTGRGTGRVLAILPRRNKISRVAAGSAHAKPVEQILAANLDQVIAFCAVDRLPPEWQWMDRMLALAETAGLPAVLLLSKIDALPDSPSGREGLRAEADEFQRIGYRVIFSSARTRAGITEVQAALQGKTSLLLGKSGAGKSTLLNSLRPDLALPTRGTSRFGEGRCTTSNAQLYPLDSGAVVDSPGLRTLTMWNPDGSDAAYGYREMRPWLGRCRFGLDCRHMDEPGCAIRRAVEAGTVSPRRFRSMLRMAGGGA